jgi:hypothetical protein
VGGTEQARRRGEKRRAEITTIGPEKRRGGERMNFKRRKPSKKKK